MNYDNKANEKNPAKLETKEKRHERREETLRLKRTEWRKKTNRQRVETTNDAHEVTDGEDENPAARHLGSFDRHPTDKDSTSAGTHDMRVPCVTPSPWKTKQGIQGKSLNTITATYPGGRGH